MPASGNDDRSENLTRRLNALFGRHSKPSTLANFRAIVGPRNESLTAASVLAREKLQAGVNLTEREWKALELMVRLSRPSMLIRSGVPEPMPAGKTARIFPAWDSLRGAIRPYVRSIGLLVKGTSKVTARNGVGTGFLVAPDVLVTNRHVSEMLKSSSGALECVVRFRVEADEYLREQVVKVSKLICDSTRTDVAALQLSEEVKSPPLPMERGRVDPGAQVTVVGHPFPDNERNPNFISLVFGNEFYLKRASPGEVIPMRGKADASFDHDCSTLGGNSGSPIVSMASGKVVGLHREGSFLERNSGIGAASLLRFLAKCKV